MHRSLIILLVLLFILQLVLASPISTSVPISGSKAVTSIKLEGKPIHEKLRHAHPTSTKPTATRRLVTVVQAKTLRFALPSSTEILTEIVEMTTALPNPTILLSSLHSSTSNAHTSTLPKSLILFSITETSSTSAISLPTPSSVNPIVTSSTSSTLTTVSGLSATPTGTAGREHWELSTGTLIAVTIAGSVAANILAVTLWLLIRNSCSRTDSTVDAEGKALGDLVEKHGLGDHLQEDFKNQPTAEVPRQFDADVTIPEQFEIQPAPSSDQPPIPVSYSSFWSAASSQWTLERARSHELEASESRESETPRPFTTFNLGTTLRTDPSSIGIIEPFPAMEGLGDNSHKINLNSSPDLVQHDQTLTVPALPNASESSRDPRSPRRLSIPLFMENYASPSLAHCFPADTQSITMTYSGRSSYNLETGSMLLPEMESSSTEVEGELGSGRIKISASIASLPSVSSGVMTPRRHWTFVDIHGPSAHTVSPQASGNILNHLPGAESSHTLAVQVPSISVDHLGSGSSQTPLSEATSADSFLHSDCEPSARSGISEYFTPNNDSVDVLDHSRRTF